MSEIVLHLSCEICLNSVGIYPGSCAADAPWSIHCPACATWAVAELVGLALILRSRWRQSSECLSLHDMLEVYFACERAAAARVVH